MSKKKKNAGLKNTDKDEFKYRKVEFAMNIFSVFISLIALFISINSNIISNFQADMEYKANLPNFNMSVDYSDPEQLQCDVVNDGGNIREATIFPHMYFEMRICPNYVIKKSYAVEISDFFANRILGLYISDPIVNYDANQKKWNLHIDDTKMKKDFLFFLKCKKL